MNEQDLFDIMDGLPERQIAEAAEWKYRHGKAQANEIDAILTSSPMPEKITYRNTPPEAPDTEAETVVLSRPANGSGKQSRIVRSGTAGLAAVAAIFALAFGGIALKLYRDNNEIAASQPGAAVSDGDFIVTELTGDDIVNSTVIQTQAVVFHTTDPGTTVTFDIPETPAEHKEDNTVSAGETNFLGGKGLLRPVTSEGNTCILQDDEYIYIQGNRKVRKTALDPLKSPSPDLICQKAGCLHNTGDCLLNKYGNLMSGGTDIYYADWETESVQQGFCGGLKRIYSDGTTEEIHPQNKISPADEVSGKIVGIIYYTHILRLGDTGIYYLKGDGLLYNDDESYTARDIPPVLMNSSTGETIALNISEYAYIDHYDDYAAMFDEASGHLFLSITDPSDTCNRIDEIDVYTGAILQEYNSRDEKAEILSWFVKDHQLHYLGETPEDRYKVNWYVHDMDTQETKVLLADCGFSSFAYCDGRVYATYHASVGNDAIYSYAPDGTDAVKLTESNTLFRSLMPVASPDCIGINSNTGSIYVLLPDGQTYRLQ